MYEINPVFVPAVALILALAIVAVVFWPRGRKGG